MRVIYEFCKQGESVANEDACGYKSFYAWVIDGATDVYNMNTLKKPNEVSWYVKRLNKKLKAEAGIRDDTNERIISYAIKELYEELNGDGLLESVPDYTLPTFAISMIKVKNQILNYYLLGDCTIAILHNHKIITLKDERVREYSIYNRKKIKKYIDNHPNENVPKELFQETRKKANREDGYPIGMINGKGITDGILGEIDVFERDRILIYSDGLLDYISAHQNALESFFDEEKIPDELERMYEFLSNNANYSKSPRPKKVDDSTLLLLEV